MPAKQKRREGRPVFLSVALAAAESYASATLFGKVLVHGPLKEPVARLDKDFTDAVKDTSGDKADKLMALMSGLGEPSALYPITGLAAVWWLIRGRKADSAALSIALVGSALMNKAIKQTVSRPRPRFTLHRQRSSGSSYPSNHVTMAFAVYGAIAYLIARRLRRGKKASKRRIRLLVWSPAILLCSLIAWSRIYQGVHHLTDVLAGWLVGSIWIGACAQVVRRLSGAEGSSQVGDK